MPEMPWDKIARSQRAAAGLFSDTVGRMVEMGKTGVTKPDEVLREVTAMGLAMADLLSATARPLEFFVNSQRQLAETMHAAAVLQRQLAEVLEAAAANHAAMVEALELMTNPVLGMAALLRAEDRPGEKQAEDTPTQGKKAGGTSRTSTTKAKKQTTRKSQKKA